MERERRSFTVEFKLRVIKYAEENSGEAAARHFEIDSKTVRTWKKRKPELETLAATKEGERKRITKGPRKGKKDKNQLNQVDHSRLQRVSVEELVGGDLCANCMAVLHAERTTTIKVTEAFAEEDRHVVVEEALATVLHFSWTAFLHKLKQKRKRRRSEEEDEDVALRVALCKNCALFLEEIYAALCSFESLSHAHSLIRQAKEADHGDHHPPLPSLDNHDNLFDDFHFHDDRSASEEEVEVKYTDPAHQDVKLPPEALLLPLEEQEEAPWQSDHASSSADSDTQLTRVRRRKRRRRSVAAEEKTKTKKKKEYKCGVCEETFALKTKLLVHARVHREPRQAPRPKAGPFPCQICGKVFKNREYVRKHERKRHSRQNVACAECGKVMKNESTLSYHMKTIHIPQEEKDKMKTTCEVCGKSMLLLALKQHMLLHTEVRKKFACDKCEKAFASEQRLALHLEAHLSTTVHPCALCGRSFPIAQYLKEHEENHHKTEKPFGCDHCAMRFKSKSKAEDHKRIHAPEKAFVCEECGKSCATQKHLNQHVKCHRDEEKGPDAFKCPDCGKCFKNRYCLYAHKIRSHRTDLIAGKRIFSCHICGKSLYDERNLKKHIEAVHNKEKGHPPQRPPPDDFAHSAAFPNQTLIPIHSTFLI